MIDLNKRLLAVGGKGGVGKTTVTVALGLLAAGSGKRTLLIEVGENEKIAPLFGLEPVGYRETQLAPNLWGIYLSPERSFAEYIKRTLRIERLWRPIVESRLFQSFSAAAPGFKELMTLGKIMDIERAEGTDGRALYDLLILDAPATGHGLSFFRTAQIAMQGTRAGPVFKNARKIVDLLRDPARTAFHVVTLPEEMPVNEAVEMAQAVLGTLAMPLGAIVVNGVERGVLEAGEAALYASLQSPPGRAALEGAFGPAAAAGLLKTTDRLEARRALAREHIERLRALVDRPLIEVPFFYDVPWTLDSVRRVGERLR